MFRFFCCQSAVSKNEVVEKNELPSIDQVISREEELKASPIYPQAQSILLTIKR